MNAIQINLTKGKAKSILVLYTLAFAVLSYLGRELLLQTLIIITSYAVFYLGLLTIVVSYYPKPIIYLKEKNLLDVFIVVSLIYFGSLYHDLARGIFNL